ncbi:MAG: thermonuclease family protein [Nitrospirae bacterium]|nr:thermonuclease family protein [Nitrospirota bacterium]
MVARHFGPRLVVLSIATLGFFISPFSTVLASDFSGKVVGIIDGDTIEVLHNQYPERVRLNGIDCPEKGQAYGKRAKQAASELVFGKQVRLQIHGKDKYGRTIADVLLPDGTNVNHSLVKDGWCWWYPKHAPDNVILAELQRRARRSGLGLWTDPAPIPPWEWQKQRK